MAKISLLPSLAPATTAPRGSTIFEESWKDFCLEKNSSRHHHATHVSLAETREIQTTWKMHFLSSAFGPHSIVKSLLFLHRYENKYLYLQYIIRA